MNSLVERRNLEAVAGALARAEAAIRDLVVRTDRMSQAIGAMAARVEALEVALALLRSKAAGHGPTVR